jgi:hypothetical protein
MAAKAARERLEQTRRELLRHMSHDRAAHAEGMDSPHPHPAGQEQDMDQPDEPFMHAPDEDGLGSLWRKLQHTASAWWHSHPAHLALEVAEPLFDKYARAHPTKVLTMAAATGAALVLIKPWRLISVTGLLVAAARSTQVSALAAALLRPQAAGSMRRQRAHEAQDQTHPNTQPSRQATSQPAQGKPLASQPLH